jgi:hypothetical protein
MVFNSSQQFPTVSENIVNNEMSGTSHSDPQRAQFRVTVSSRLKIKFTSSV